MTQQLWQGYETYSNHLVLSSSGKILAIRTEANASDVQVTASVGVIVLQYADLLSSDNVVYLSRLVTSCCNIFPIHAESHAADNALMRQSVNKVYIEETRDGRVEHDEPIVPSFLVLSRKPLDIEVAQSVG